MEIRKKMSNFAPKFDYYRKMNIYKIVSVLALSLMVLSSCGEYNKLLKSNDPDEKYEYAKTYFEQGKYSKAATLLTDVVPIYRGTEEAENALWLLAMSYFNQKDYLSAGEYFVRYANNYPRGKHAMEARFNVAYGDYKDSPDARLDQEVTKRAIKELDSFVDLYPHSALADSAAIMRLELSDKLCYKEYLSAKLYLNLGTYRGNNYESAVITARNAQNEFPYSKYREDLAYVIYRARYEAAMISVSEKLEDRLREASDEYYTFINDYPEGKYSLKDFVKADTVHLEYASAFYNEVNASVREWHIMAWTTQQAYGTGNNMYIPVTDIVFFTDAQTSQVPTSGEWPFIIARTIDEIRVGTAWAGYCDVEEQRIYGSEVIMAHYASFMLGQMVPGTNGRWLISNGSRITFAQDGFTVSGTSAKGYPIVLSFRGRVGS